MAKSKNLSFIQINSNLINFRKIIKDINSDFIDTYFKNRLIESGIIESNSSSLDILKIEPSIKNKAAINSIFHDLESIIQTGIAYSRSVLIEDIKIPGVTKVFEDFFEMFAFLKKENEKLFSDFKRYNDINYHGVFYSYDIKIIDEPVYTDTSSQEIIDNQKRLYLNEVFSRKLRQLSKTFSTKIPGVGIFSNKKVFIFRHFDVIMDSYYFIVHYSTTKNNSSLGDDSIISNASFDSKNSFYFIINVSNGFSRLIIKKPTHDSYLLAFIRSINQVLKDEKIQVDLFSSEISNFSALTNVDTIQKLSYNTRISVREMEFLYPEKNSKLILSSSSNNIFLTKDDGLLSNIDNLSIKRLKIQQLDSEIKKVESLLEIRQDSIKIEEGGINSAIQLLKALGLDDALSSESFSFENFFCKRCAFNFSNWINLPESAIKNYTTLQSFILEYRPSDLDIKYSRADLSFSSDTFKYTLNGGTQTQGKISNHFQFQIQKNEMLKKLLGKGFEEDKIGHQIKGIYTFSFLENKKTFKVVFAENLQSLIEYDTYLHADNIVFLKNNIISSQLDNLLKFFALGAKNVRFFSKESLSDFLINPSAFIKNQFEIGTTKDIFAVSSSNTNKLNPDDLERMKYLLIDYNEYASGGKKTDIYGSLYHIEFEKNFWKIISCFYSKIFPLGADASGGGLPDSFMLGKDTEGDKIFIIDAKSTSAQDPLTYIGDEGEKLGRYLDEFRTPNTKSIVIIVGPKVSASKFESIHISEGSKKGSQLWENMLNEGKRFIYIDSDILNFLKNVILSKRFHEAKGQIKQNEFFSLISKFAIKNSITVIPKEEFKKGLISCIRTSTGNDGKGTSYTDDCILNEKIASKTVIGNKNAKNHEDMIHEFISDIELL